MGNLYIVATPIGNLEDITYRAIRILGEVDCIICEDKRITLKLLSRYEIKTPLKAYHKFNESQCSEEVISELMNGKNIALVTDAGTPIISDPGSKLIQKAHENDLKVIPIPGPSALATALSAFGVELNDFLFLGFLPDKSTKRKELLELLVDKTSFAVIYVAPHDLKKYLSEINETYPVIKIYMARELTKIYEEIVACDVKELMKKIEDVDVKGEIVLGLDLKSVPLVKISEEVVLLEMEEMVEKGTSLKDASKELGKKYNVQSSRLYNLYITECR